MFGRLSSRSALKDLLLASLIVMLSIPSVTLATSDYSHIQGLIEEAKTFRLSGRYDNAEAKLLRAQRIAPRSADVYLEFAYLRRDQGKFNDLQSVVDLGSKIADGPVVSLAHLKALKSQLATALPMSPTQSFVTPPPIAMLESASPEMTPRDLPANRPRVQGTGYSRSLVDAVSHSANRDIRDAPDDQIDASAPARQKPESKLQFSSETERMGINNRIFELQRDERAGSDDIELSAIGEPIDPKTPSAAKNPTSGKSGSSSDVSSTIPQALTPIQSVNPVVVERVGETSSKKTFLAGVGVLDRPRSGIWMSPGIVETEF